MPAPRPLYERFWAKVERCGPDECWPWLGATHPFGYGRIGVGRRSTGDRRTETAHRVSWEINIGPVPRGKHVLHRCDNPPCVNPAHLFLGDQAENAHDMYRKGRGRGQFPAVLAPATVQEIRGRLRAGESQDSVARALGISQTSVSQIARGQTYKIVPDEELVSA